MESLDIRGEIVEFWTYRKAFVNATFVLEISSNTWMHKQLMQYVEENGYKFGNHICWKTDDGMYYGYSDHTLYVGTSIRVGSY